MRCSYTVLYFYLNNCPKIILLSGHTKTVLLNLFFMGFYETKMCTYGIIKKPKSTLLLKTELAVTL